VLEILIVKKKIYIFGC